MRYINFTAFDSNIKDANGKPVIEYIQSGVGLTEAEKTEAARWLLSEVMNPADRAIIEKIIKEPVASPSAPGKAKGLTRAESIYFYLKDKMRFDEKINDEVFYIMRRLKEINPGDTYLEAYEGHLARNPFKFLDYYHILVELGQEFRFNNVMEIGCRTGISICQLLYHQKIMSKRVVLFDLFNDAFVYPNLVRMNLKHLGIQKEPVFIAGDSKVTVPRFFQDNPSEKMDYILVDGDHSREGAMTDLLNVEPMLAEGGMIVFDDISTNAGECGLIDVWNKFKQGREDKYFWLESMIGKGFGIAIKK